MLATTANKLRPNDTFTANDGVDWYRVVDVYEVKVTSDARAVLVTTDDYEKIWLWAEEDVTVRL